MHDYIVTECILEKSLDHALRAHCACLCHILLRGCGAKLWRSHSSSSDHSQWSMHNRGSPQAALVAGECTTTMVPLNLHLGMPSKPAEPTRDSNCQASPDGTLLGLEDHGRCQGMCGQKYHRNIHSNYPGRSIQVCACTIVVMYEQAVFMQRQHRPNTSMGKMTQAEITFICIHIATKYMCTAEKHNHWVPIPDRYTREGLPGKCRPPERFVCHLACSVLDKTRQLLESGRVENTSSPH